MSAVTLIAVDTLSNTAESGEIKKQYISLEDAINEAGHIVKFVCMPIL